MTIPGPMKLAQFRHRSGFGSGNSAIPHGGIASWGIASWGIEPVGVAFGDCMALLLEVMRSDLLRGGLVRIAVVKNDGSSRSTMAIANFQCSEQKVAT